MYPDLEKLLEVKRIKEEEEQLKLKLEKELLEKVNCDKDNCDNKEEITDNKEEDNKDDEGNNLENELDQLRKSKKHFFQFDTNTNVNKTYYNYIQYIQ